MPFVPEFVNSYNSKLQKIVQGFIFRKQNSNQPEDKAEEISEFADFVIKRYEEFKLTEGIRQLSSNSVSFKFLHEEVDLYTLKDLKEVYND